MKFMVEHEDAMHPDAFVISAFNDHVGIACDEDCAQRAVDDIVADHPDADAGYEPANVHQVNRHRYCMGCGEEVA